MTAEQAKQWQEIIGSFVALGLAGWALTYVVEPWMDVSWWRATLAVFVVKQALPSLSRKSS